MKKAGVAVTIKLHEAVIRGNEPGSSITAPIAFDPVPAFILDSPGGSNHTDLLVSPERNLASLAAAVRSRGSLSYHFTWFKISVSMEKNGLGPAALSVAGLH